MYEILVSTITFVQNCKIGLSGQFINVFFITGRDLPFSVNGLIFIRIGSKYRYTVHLRCHRMTEEFQIRIISELLLQIPHIHRHDRTNGLATRKEKVSHIDFAFKILLSDDLTVLVDQIEV